MTPQQRVSRFIDKQLAEITMLVSRRKHPGSFYLEQDVRTAFVEGFTQGFCLGSGVKQQPGLPLPEPTEWR